MRSGRIGRGPLAALGGVALALAAGTLSHAETPWSEAQAEMTAAIDEGDCARAWETAWPLALEGSADARAALVASASTVGLMPPGAFLDALSRYRHATILALHSAGADEAFSEMISAVLQSGATRELLGETLVACVAGGGNAAAACIDEAVASGALPSMEAYGEELAVLAARPGAEASCEGPGTTGPEDLPTPTE